ncbi:endonuclease/exonuclease/phosphatase family protein [Pseudoroseicyclus tamaricis]|nr:endonuclease/exonuclease/phosphatase family protein [Pseudoroseicyclus tamaricis]
MLASLLAGPSLAETLRFAVYGAELSRDGPGLLLMDLLEPDAQAAATAQVIAEAAPDVLLLTDMDYDHGGAALGALQALLAAEGHEMRHRFAARPNSGMATGLDMDGDGRTGAPRDAQGYGTFAGQGGLALLSRYPLSLRRDFTPLPWRDLPGATPPTLLDGAPFPSEEAAAAQRLSSSAHWVVQLDAPGGPVTLMAWAATPPVFDGPEDRNGLRARDELLLWRRYLGGELGPAPEAPFLLMGLSNLDPEEGDGDTTAMAAFLADHRLQDPLPRSETGGLATAAWEEEENGTGPLRVTYILPSADWDIADAGVLWPANSAPLAAAAEAAGPHRLVWVEVAR